MCMITSNSLLYLYYASKLFENFINDIQQISFESELTIKSRYW